ncbi:TPA: hypothetical protein O2Z46_000651 [Staphylococcus aureus]|uniref:hypothetical protein n=1 Tax=Staphylococcus aureus TaxID=1280 RepID=UPI0001DD9B7D|nr:hypothetical protein [Staphylococcus aureus]HDJ6917963.1 hypothetical protein [Staphylococcus aureus Sa_TPS3169]HDJ6919868.1 hypothetical protein [Staphylococcus aureus Sa_TPS3162]HDJ6928050.1 hypothetical protein [Staphylococcus aureus Sa_TPS3157]HDJ6931452.1 hypothetical protein [Staphylococcus aureus Sa_TPS3148]HDJ6936060.1 hypothetical protein [Staphylococcus aureus Sa_TPS3161]HDJ6942631.1 hypothetical protein [Staphylococcus aureus Sa_TPS3174]HDJ6948230.1 hypothetical protein [Staphy
MNMNLIIGKIAIWIGIVVQIFYSVVIVSITTFILFINAKGASPEIAVLIALVIILILTLPPILTAINLENKMEVKGTLFIVYAIVAFCMFNYLSSILWVVCGIFLIWTKYSKGESTDDDENEKVDIESTENQFDSKDKITKE